MQEETLQKDWLYRGVWTPPTKDLAVLVLFWKHICTRPWVLFWAWIFSIRGKPSGRRGHAVWRPQVSERSRFGFEFCLSLASWIHVKLSLSFLIYKMWRVTAHSPWGAGQAGRLLNKCARAHTHTHTHTNGSYWEPSPFKCNDFYFSSCSFLKEPDQTVWNWKIQRRKTWPVTIQSEYLQTLLVTSFFPSQKKISKN